MCPATPRCDQQGSDSLKFSHLPPPLFRVLSVSSLTIVSSPFSKGRMHHLDMAPSCHGNIGSGCCGNRLFIISSNEIDSKTSLQLSHTVVHARDREGAGV